uniref:Uncharacterized protein n=1 Tax=Rhizophora mucronata TaxID=61149 RepID=A0A2P2NIC7_RHIMU
MNEKMENNNNNNFRSNYIKIWKK